MSERTPEEDRAVAFHEAAHAVFYLSQGIGVKRLTIVPDEGYEGCCFAHEVGLPGLPDDWPERFEEEEEIQRIVEFSLASGYVGPIGERMVRGDQAIMDQTEAGYSVIHAPEIKRLIETFEHLTDSRESSVFQHWVEGFCEQLLQENRPAMEALVEALLVERDIEGVDRVRGIADQAGGVQPRTLPAWSTVRKAAFAQAPRDLDWVMEGEEPEEVTVRLPRWIMQEVVEPMIELECEICPRLRDRPRWEQVSQALYQIAVGYRAQWQVLKLNLNTENLPAVSSEADEQP